MGDFVFKVLILGDAGVGKSCLLLRYVDNVYKDGFISTIGVDFKVKNLNIDDKSLKLKIWDTAGQERFRTITSSYYRGADGIILVYDCQDSNALEGVKQWLNEINRYASSEANKILVGNKTDLPSKVIDTATAKKFAEDLGFLHYECSALNGSNIDEMFSTLAKIIMDRMDVPGAYQAPGTNQVKVKTVGSKKKNSICVI